MKAEVKLPRSTVVKPVENLDSALESGCGLYPKA